MADPSTKRQPVTGERWLWRAGLVLAAVVAYQVNPNGTTIFLAGLLIGWALRDATR